MRKNTSQRTLAVFLCIVLFISYFGSVDMKGIFAFAAQDIVSGENSDSHAADEKHAIKDRLMYQIKYEGWDPYSSDMSLEEFYALMELFRDGALPLREGSPSTYSAALTALSEGDAAQSSSIIPRDMFLMSGFADYTGEDKPEHSDKENETGYFLPPDDWGGVKAMENGDSEAFVIVPGVNNDNLTIAGDVDQKLFPSYDGCYVRRVTAQDAEVSILGVIKLNDKIVYYYLTSDTQSTEVSTTMLPEGQKFIIHYQPNEHNMQYQVKMNTTSGEDVTNQWADYIFGADRPLKTTDRYYSFVATVPYGYTMQIFRLVHDGQNVYEEITGKYSATKITHNDGYPLGTEPVYKEPEPKTKGFRIEVDTDNGPSTLKMSDAFYNASVDADRTIIAVLTEKPEPQFDSAAIIKVSDGTSNRGSSAVRTITVTNKETNQEETIPYDFEDEYLFRKNGVNGRQSKYKGYTNNAAYGNITSGDNWNWQNDNESQATHHIMYKEDDGTYSYQWTFQTNNSDEYLMDVLEINGVPITLPFFPKYTERGDTLGTDKKGITCWYTEATITNDINVRVELLMTFTGNNNIQRVYHIAITNARSNVTITGMNLMQYKYGADEISTYDLSGIYADNDDNTVNTSQAAVQFYDKKVDESNKPYRAEGWYREAVSNVHIDSINYDTGDPKNHGANIRFRLADGYDSPYYLFESSRAGTIAGTDGKEQASVSRDAEGNVNLDALNEIRRMSDLEQNETLDSRYVYDGGDGWYYIRVTQQDPHKMALLTIGAREVKYVVRYLGTYPNSGIGEPDDARTWDKIGDAEEQLKLDNNTFAGIVKNVKNVPEFTHIDGICHPSFHKDENNGIPGEHYDDKNGDYYDTVKDTVALVPLDVNSTPTDPENKYTFVDWVLVDENYKPVTDAHGNEYHYLGNTIKISDINEYAIKNDGLGGSTVDVYVLRLMPTWKKIVNPFGYKVALNWVDAQGELHEDFFDDYWSAVVTDWQLGGGGLTVKVLKDAEPFQDWIAQNPTYTFWDGVNNNNALYRYYNQYIEEGMDEKEAHTKAHDEMEKEMARAIAEYLPFMVVDGKIVDEVKYNAVLNALCRRDIAGKDADGNNGNGIDDFWRLGSYAFQVLEDEGTIVIWMHEDKGGLMFHEEVEKEPFIYDEEFYFTVSNVQAGINIDNSNTPAAIAEGDEDNNGTVDNIRLSATYKAYPQQVYDEFGNPRAVKDKDAWLVTFKDGEIVSIVKNDGSEPPEEPVTYFTLKSGEGIMLYVPKGRYTIAELGSKSGGSYKTEVDYNGDKDPSSQDWDLPNSDEKELWLSGNRTEYFGNNKPEGVSQIAATVNFGVGAINVVSVLTFHNQTCSLAIGDEVLNSKYSGNDTFTYNVKLNLPEDVMPLYDEENDVYYYNCNVYNIDADGKWKPASTGTITLSKKTSNVGDQAFNWEGSVTLSANQVMTLIMTVPSTTENVLYYVDQGNITLVEGTDSQYKLSDGQQETRQGTISAGNRAEQIYTYSPKVPTPGKLTVKCDVVPDESDLAEYVDDVVFTYTVTITNMMINSQNDDDYGGMIFHNSVATITLRAGESISALNLPDNVRYTVVQEPSTNYKLDRIVVTAEYMPSSKEANKTSFTIDKSNASVSGTITGDYEDIITFTNKLVIVILPSSGGRGTVIFYLLGGSMTLLAMSYLAFTAKKRRKQDV